MTRFPDWPERLGAFLTARADLPFAWGRNDCCLFAADWVLAATGRDPAAALRGRYRSAGGAVRALKRFCGGGVAEAAARIAAGLGCPEIPPALAQRGDVALLEAAEGPALGVVAGLRIAALAPGGLGFLPASAAVRAWRV